MEELRMNNILLHQNLSNELERLQYEQRTMVISAIQAGEDYFEKFQIYEDSIKEVETKIDHIKWTESEIDLDEARFDV
jgi:hypothetical protein